MANDGILEPSLQDNNSTSSAGYLDRIGGEPDIELITSDFVPSHHEVINRSTSKVSEGEPAEEMRFTIEE